MLPLQRKNFLKEAHMNSLAIVIPYYKIDFFEETLKSVAAQTDKQFKLYIGNDASPYNPLPLIQKYFPDGNYHYFNYEENLGGKNLALQWERILENVTEPWFQILGDDDVVPADFVATFYNNLPVVDENKITCIKYAHKWIDEIGEIIIEFINENKVINSIDFFQKKYLNEVKSSLSENIFLYDMYKRYKFYKLPLAWGTDDLAILTFSNFGYIHYIPTTMVMVRISEKNISGRQDNLHEKDLAQNSLQQVVINNFINLFPVKFKTRIITDYLYSCKKLEIGPQIRFKTYRIISNKILLKFFRVEAKIHSYAKSFCNRSLL